MADQPSKTGQNGRDTATGRFTAGNKVAAGNQGQRFTQRIRAVFQAAITDKDFKAVIRSLVDAAKKGDVRAAQIVIEHCLGRPCQRVEVDQAQPLFDPMAERAAYESAVSAVDAGDDVPEGMDVPAPPPAGGASGPGPPEEPDQAPPGP